MANTVTTRFNEKGARQVMSQADKLNAKVKNLQKQGAKGILTGFAAGVGLGAIQAAGRAVGMVTDKVSELTDAYIDDERSQRQLGQSLAANVTGWNGNTAAIERVLKARMKLGFSDDEQRDSLSRLVAATHDVDEALKIQATAMDLARFKGISLADATDALTKVEAGSFRILKSLGISLQDGATQTEALAAVQAVANGQAATFAQTIEGKLVVANVRSAEAMERHGKATADLSVAWNKFWADSLDPSGMALEDFANSPGWSRLTEAAREAGITAERAWDLFQEGADLTGPALRAAADEADGLAAAAFRASEKSIGLSAASGDVSRELRDFARAAQRVEDTVKDATATLEPFTDAITDAMFAADIAAGKEQDLADRIAELAKELKGTKDAGDAVKLKGQIAELRQSLFELHLEEAAAEGPEAAIEFLRRERKNAGAAKDEIDKLIQSYQLLAGITVKLPAVLRAPAGRYAGKALPAFADGGIVTKPTVALIGEKGPEAIVPLNKGGAGGGGMHLTINVSTPALTPGGAESLARYLEPIITRAQQRRGLVGAARAF